MGFSFYIMEKVSREGFMDMTVCILKIIFLHIHGKIDDFLFSFIYVKPAASKAFDVEVVLKELLESLL